MDGGLYHTLLLFGAIGSAGRYLDPEDFSKHVVCVGCVGVHGKVDMAQSTTFAALRRVQGPIQWGGYRPTMSVMLPTP